MTDRDVQLVVFTAIPMIATVLGGIIAAHRSPGPRLRSTVQHVAAGVVFAACAGELLPDIVRRQQPWEVALGFGLGIAAMLAVRTLTKERDDGNPHVAPFGLLLVLGVDVLLDGLLVGIGFAAGAEEGMLLSIALTLEFLFLGLSASAALSAARASRTMVLLTPLSLALVLATGAAAGALLLRGVSSGVMEVVLSFGLAALLYLVTEELLVEAHEVPETPLATAAFFIGFLALTLFQMAALTKH